MNIMTPLRHLFHPFLLFLILLNALNLRSGLSTELTNTDSVEDNEGDMSKADNETERKRARHVAPDDKVIEAISKNWMLGNTYWWYNTKCRAKVTKSKSSAFSDEVCRSQSSPPTEQNFYNMCFDVQIDYNYSLIPAFNRFPEKLAILQRFPRCWSSIGPLICAQIFRPCRVSKESYVNDQNVAKVIQSNVAVVEIFAFRDCLDAHQHCDFLPPAIWSDQLLNCETASNTLFSRRCNLQFTGSPATVARRRDRQCIWPLVNINSGLNNGTLSAVSVTGRPLIDDCFMPCETPLITDRPSFLWIRRVSLMVVVLFVLVFGSISLYLLAFSQVFFDSFEMFIVGNGMFCVFVYYFLWMFPLSELFGKSAICLQQGTVRNQLPMLPNIGFSALLHFVSLCVFEAFVLSLSLTCAYAWLVVLIWQRHFANRPEKWRCGTSRLLLDDFLVGKTLLISARGLVSTLIYLFGGITAILAVVFVEIPADAVTGACHWGSGGGFWKSMAFYAPLYTLNIVMIVALFFRYSSMIKVNLKRVKAGEKLSTVNNIELCSAAESKSGLSSPLNNAAEMGGACHRTSGAVAGRTIGGTKDGTASSAVKRSDEESEVPLIVDKSGRNGDMSDDKFRNVRRLCSGRVISDEIYALLLVINVMVLLLNLAAQFILFKDVKTEEELILENIRCSLNSTLVPGGTDLLSHGWTLTPEWKADMSLSQADLHERKLLLERNNSLTASNCELAYFDNVYLGQLFAFIVFYPSLPFLLIAVWFVCGISFGHTGCGRKIVISVDASFSATPGTGLKSNESSYLLEEEEELLTILRRRRKYFYKQRLDSSSSSCEEDRLGEKANDSNNGGNCSTKVTAVDDLSHSSSVITFEKSTNVAPKATLWASTVTPQTNCSNGSQISGIFQSGELRSASAAMPPQSVPPPLHSEVPLLGNGLVSPTAFMLPPSQPNVSSLPGFVGAALPAHYMSYIQPPLGSPLSLAPSVHHQPLTGYFPTYSANFYAPYSGGGTFLPPHMACAASTLAGTYIDKVNNSSIHPSYFQPVTSRYGSESSSMTPTSVGNLSVTSTPPKVTAKRRHPANSTIPAPSLANSDPTGKRQRKKPYPRYRKLDLEGPLKQHRIQRTIAERSGKLKVSREEFFSAGEQQQLPPNNVTNLNYINPVAVAMPQQYFPLLNQHGSQLVYPYLHGGGDNGSIFGGGDTMSLLSATSATTFNMTSVSQRTPNMQPIDFYNSGYREGALKEQQKLEHHIGELTKNLEIASAFIQQFHFNHSVNNGGGSGGVGSGGERSGVEGSVQHNQFDQCSSHLPMNGPLYGGEARVNEKVDDALVGTASASSEHTVANTPSLVKSFDSGSRKNSAILAMKFGHSTGSSDIIMGRLPTASSSVSSSPSSSDEKETEDDEETDEASVSSDASVISREEEEGVSENSGRSAPLADQLNVSTLRKTSVASLSTDASDVLRTTTGSSVDEEENEDSDAFHSSSPDPEEERYCNAQLHLQAAAEPSNLLSKADPPNLVNDTNESIASN